MYCKDESGNNVAWWAALKANSGTSYVYADVNSPTFKKSAYTMADGTKGALSNTLNQIYVANKTQPYGYSAFVMYNDETPDGKSSSSRGHTKGVVGSTQDGAFWLVHSVPSFPNFVAQGYTGYNAATTYAQSFLCISMPVSDLSYVGTQYYYNFPQYYDFVLPSWVPASMVSSVASSSHTTAAVSNILKIGASLGTTFTSFAKTSNWNNYLYENLVAPYWNSDLYCETWMNGANPDPTFCKGNGTYKYDVMNVRSLTVGGFSWLETQDHSKWAVTNKPSGLTILCIGDINRQQSQNTRAGGTVCFSHSQMWSSLYGTITTADTCPM